MNTLKYAIRFLLRSKSYTLINLFGLAFSLACCIILMRYIHREWTVDSHCIRPDEVVTLISKNGEFQFPVSQENTLQFHPDLKELLIPDDKIIESCEFVLLTDIDFKLEEASYNLDILAVDSTYFHFFEYPLLEGEARIDTPQDAVITKICTQRLFGKESAVGKVLKAFGKDVTIRGVIDQPTCKSILNFDILISHKLNQWSRIGGGWLRVLPHQVNLDTINAKTNVFGSVKPNPVQDNKYVRNEYIHWKDIYYDYWTEKGETLNLGNRTYERMLIGVIIVLLLVAIINFINLYMVYMMKRQKEYGIKKVFGLQGLPLFIQIWLENLLLAIVALLAAWLLVEITIPLYERLINEPMKGYNLFDLQLSLVFLSVFPIATSFYPFIKHNYFNPITSLRSMSGNGESIVIRMSFLFLQYAITLTLLIVAVYFNRHLQFLQDTPTGFRSEGILYAQLVNRNQYEYGSSERKNYEEIWSKQVSFYEQKLNECPFIEKWSPNRSESILLNRSEYNVINDKDESHQLIIRFVGRNYFDIHELNVIDGTIPETEKDVFNHKVVLNEAAMKLFGYQSASEAFVRSEQPLWFSYNPKTKEYIKGGVELMPVDAVISNYYASHVSEGIQPIMFLINNDNMNGNVAITIQKGKEKEIIDYLGNMVKEMTGNSDFVYSWLQDEVNALYDDDRRLTVIYNIFALVSILVSCLGLFGISLFDIRQRYREIAIRKVNGAGMKDLYQLLFKKYLTVLGASFVVSVPLAYYLIHQYTAEFVVKAPISIGIFVIALVLVAIISMGTLYWQIHKAANIDPAKIMKTE